MAVLDREPVALEEIVPVAVYVIVEPAGMSTISLILPVPAAAPVAPPVNNAVQVIPDNAVVNVSVTVVPGASDGPLLDTVMV